MLKNTVNTFVLAAIAASEVSAETDADGNFVPGPVAVIHGMNSSCPMEFWVDAIAEAIDYKAVVKCIEVGDGITTSLFERNEW